MRIRKGLLIGLICVLIAVIGAFCFVGCNPDKPNGDDPVIDGPSGEQPGEENPGEDDPDDPDEPDIGTDVGDVQDECTHVYGEWTVKTAATCTSEGELQRKCSKCNNVETDVIAKLSHKFTTYTSDHNATCTADGTKTATCDNKGCTATQTIADAGSKTGHDMAVTSTRAATCVTHGEEVRTCQNDGCDYTETKQIIATGHIWNAAAATCTQGVKCTVKDCEASKPALGHDYVTNYVERTCTEDGKTVHTCSRCNDSYDTDIEHATGHSVYAWSTEDPEYSGYALSSDNPCEYQITYHGYCEECYDLQTKTETVIRHNLVKVISKVATCIAEGDVKTYCDGCHDSELEEITHYSNDGAHSWVDDTCEHCHITRVTYNPEEGVSKEALNNSVVAVNDAQLSLDEATLAGIKGENVKLTVQPAEGYTPPEGVQGGDVYDFTLGVDGNPVTQFGGYITITLPYNLDENEDPENIGVWYINNDGEPEKIQATYSNGYVTFKTNHFSTYTVTRLTARQRCEFYGHSYKVTEVPTSCLVTGYKIQVCQRCADTVRTENEVKATGHHIVNDPDRENVAATCTTDGYTYHVCDNDGCVYKYDQKVPALGHDWEESADSVIADCQHAGRSTYTCKNCDSSYTVTTAQLQHNYNTVVHAATCTEGGYTVFTCKYCTHTYNGDFTAAKGHTYAETVVAPTCTAGGHTLHACVDCDDSYKTDEVPAAHTWDISAPTCGKGQTCVICGTKGASATGNHTMVNGVCSVCGTGCEHTNTVTVHAPSCTEMGYTLRVCTKCGREEKSNFVEALGHEGTISCTRCHKQLLGEEFFSNALSSVLNKDFAIRVTNVSVEVEGMSYRLDFAELFVTYDANGEIYGYASGTLLGTDASYPETMTAGITAVISGGYIYAKGNLTSMMGSMGGNSDGMVYHNVIDGTQYIVIPFGKVSFNGADASPEKIYQLFPVAYEALQTKVIPFLNTLIELSGKDISTALGTVAEKFCTIEKSGAGYVLTLDNAALKNLNDNLYNYNLAENIDILFGEGTFEALKASVLDLASLTVEQIFVTASQRGLTVDELLALADEISMTLCGVSFEYLVGFDIESINDILNNEQLRATTVLDLVNSYLAMQGADFVLTVDIIEEYIDEYSAINVYELIAEYGGIDKAELKEYVDGYLDVILGGANAELYTDVYGNVTGGVLSVEETELDIEDVIVKVKGTVTLTDKVSSNINYAAVAEEVKELGSNFELSVSAVKLLYPDAKVETYDNGTVKRISGNEYRELYSDEWQEGREYEIDPETGKEIEIPIIRRVTRRRIVEYSFEFGENPILTISSDCGNWYFVSIAAENGSRREREEEFVQIFRGDVLVDERVEESHYGYGSGITVSFYYNIITGNILKPEYGNFGSEIMHDFREDANKFVPCGDGCYEWGERHYYCVDCGKTYISYFAHAHKEAVKFEPLSGDKVENCNDGYYYIRYCTECDEEIYRYISYGHYCGEVYTDVVDLSGYEVCEDHRFRVYSCACGKEQYTEFTYLPDYLGGGDDGLGGKYEEFGCSNCKLTVRQEVIYVYDKEHCQSTNTTIYTISYNGTVLKAYNDVQVSKSHGNVMKFVELAEGAETCNDGIIVSYVCIVCGEVEKTYKSYGHEEGIREVIDLEKYGAACGEKLYLFGCACGECDSMYGRHYDVTGGQGDDFGTVEGSYNNNYQYNGYWIYDSLEIRRCAVTDPVQCRLTFAVREYMSENGCYAYRKYMIGYNVEDGTSAYSFEELIQTWHNYVSGEPVAIDGCRYKLVYTCSRCGDSYETEFTQHTVGEEPEHIEGCRYGYKCAVCGEYVNTLYMHDLKWIEGKNCRWELTCSECGAVVQIEFRHEYEWVNTEGCLWSYECAGCGRVQTTEYRHNWTVDLASTCTQFGEHHCTECNLHEVLFPNDHSWYMDADGLYHCYHCDIVNINGVSGDIVLENCSKLGNGENFVVGFWLSYYNKDNQYRYDGEFLLCVTLILDGGEDEAIADVEVNFASHGGGNYVEFSKTEVEDWAEENGYSDYVVRLSFVPRGWQCDFDYAITFD